jgi:ABC-type Fe2+-enterobactin transport system substrate-binding protein
MTIIRIHDKDGAALPELPPASITILAVGTADLLQQAADLPQPCSIFIYDHQAISMQFAKEQASVRAITRWALRFGSVVTSEPHQAKDGPETWHRTDFDYFGITVTVYAHVPADPAAV